MPVLKRKEDWTLDEILKSYAGFGNATVKTCGWNSNRWSNEEPLNDEKLQELLAIDSSIVKKIMIKHDGDEIELFTF